MTTDDADYAKRSRQPDAIQGFSVPCNCYKCTGSDVRYTEGGHKYVHNNLKLHEFGEPCRACGFPKTEYRDLGTKGTFDCWWCNERAAGPYGPEPAPPTGGPV